MYKFNTLTFQLFLKLSAVIIPLFLLLLFAGIYIIYYFDSKAAQNALSDRIGNSAARVSEILSVHLAHNHGQELMDSGIARDLMSTMLADPSFVCSVLTDERGQRLALVPQGFGCQNQYFDQEILVEITKNHSEIANSAPIAQLETENHTHLITSAGSGGQSSESLPLLTGDETLFLKLRYETSELAKSTATRFYNLLFLMIFGLVGLIVSTWVAFNFIIGSPIKELISSMQSAKDVAEESTKAKSRFLATMSHEIRTPIHGIVGTTEHLATCNLGDQEKGMVETIQSSSLSLLRIVNDILDFSKFSDGKLLLKESEFDPQKPIYEAFRLLATDIYDKNLDVVVDSGDEAILPIIGDEGRFRQVIINLLSNAIKFTKRGSISVKIRSVPDEANVILSVWVTDTGRGIPILKLPQLTNAFTQSESGDSIQGTGLGLPICEQILEAMGSQLRIESIEGKGSTFSFELTVPKGLSDTTNSQIALAKRLTATDNINVLLVNDTPLVMDTQFRHLTALGVNVHKATDIVSAQRSANRQVQSGNPFDLAIIDSQIRPNDTRYINEIVAILQSLSIGKDISIALTSSKPSFTDGHLDRSTGLFEFSEPLNPESVASFLLFVKGGELDAPYVKTQKEQNNIIQFPEGFQILVADDNAINTEIMVNMLDASASSILTANNGAEAITIYRQHRPNVIFMDISMPVINGNDATKKIRAFEAKKNLPASTIIATTANVFEEDHRVSLDAGVDLVLTKPIRRSDVESVIKHITETTVPKLKTFKLKRPEQQEDLHEVTNINSIEIDMSQVLETYQLVGKTKFLEIAKKYRISVQKGFEALSNLIDAESFAPIRLLAHELRGSSGTIGFGEISTEFQKLEYLAKTRNKTACKDSLTRCLKIWNEIELELEKF